MIKNMMSSMNSSIKRMMN